MKKTTITISFEDEKMSAVKRYMQKKNANLEDELTAQLTKLYEKFVPAGVQEYIAEKDIQITSSDVDEVTAQVKRQPKQSSET